MLGTFLWKMFTTNTLFCYIILGVTILKLCYIVLVLQHVTWWRCCGVILQICNAYLGADVMLLTRHRILKWILKICRQIICNSQFSLMTKDIVYFILILFFIVYCLTHFKPDSIAENVYSYYRDIHNILPVNILLSAIKWKRPISIFKKYFLGVETM